MVNDDVIKEGSITQDEALEILENAEPTYVPGGHTFTIYSADELMTVYITVIGGAIVAFALVWLFMRMFNGFGGDRYDD